MSSSQCAKCDNLDAKMRCSRCKSILYCSTGCQNGDWKNHKQSCIPETVQGIVVFCNRDRRPGIFQPVNIGQDHDIHRLGEVAPVSRIVGLPIVAYRHIQEPWMSRAGDASLDNQIATYLMINRDGFAGTAWQKQVGTITVMRKDGKPLTKEAIETIWMYHDHLLDLFGDDPSIATRKMNRAGFDRYCDQYKKERLFNGYNEFQKMPIPL